MSWVDILKKNDNEFQISIEKEVEYNESTNYIYDSNIKDIDDEFNRIYILKIYDIKFYFKKIIDEYPLPFLNKKSPNNFFIDYIKYNCKNYYTLEKNIIKENNEYLNELEEEEEQEKIDFLLEND